MLKFFRRIRQKLLLENRISKYLLYALGEILLVVIGILIALQINNWNESRKNKIKETTVLQSLEKDFQQTQTALIESLKTYPVNIEKLTAVMDVLGKEHKLLSNAVKNNIASTGYRSTAIVEGTLNSILNTDQLELITNDSLKQLLTAYPAEVTKFKSQEANVKRVILEILRPILESYISLGEQFLEDQQEYEHLKVNFFKSDFKGLLKNKKYQNALVDRFIQTRNLNTRAERLLDVTNKAISLVKKEISKNQSK